MKFYNQVLSKSFEITQRSGSDLKVLVSEKFKFPSIDEDTYGPVLKVPKPVKAKEGFMLSGVIFQNSELGRALLMRMAMSTVEHLSVHTLISDFSLYNKWMQGKDPKLAVFVIDLIEDLCINSYVQSGQRGLLRDIAFSNAVSYATITKPEAINSKQILMQSALLSYIIAGRYRYLLPSKIKKDILLTLHDLQNFGRFLQKSNQPVTNASFCNDDVKDMKIKLAESIYKRLAKHGSVRQRLYLPYTDCHEGIDTINEETVFDLGESIGILADTYGTLGLTFNRDKTITEVLESSFKEEASNILYDLAVEQRWKKRLVQHYMNMVKNTEFDEIAFPEEDYAEYYRSYRRHAAYIRKILGQISITKNHLDSNPNQEIGQIDIQEVIQVIAAKRMNNNVFIRDEYLSKNEAWCVLLDMSTSLKPFSVTTREMALCLAEVAKDLIPGKESWGLYGFGNKFTVVKDIGEEYSANVKARIGGLGDGGLSYIPDALQLGARVVANAGKEHSYILLISDGRPTGYPDIEAKLDKTIRSIQNTGTVIISVGVGSDGLKRYLRNTSLRAETPLDLMNRFAKMYFEFSTA